MTDTVAYLPINHDPHVLVHWIQSLPKDARVTLIADHPEAQQIAAEHTAIQQVIVPDDTDAIAFAPQATATLIVPWGLSQIPLRYRAGLSIPELAPHYPLLRRAWAWGFRSLCFVSFTTETTVALPHLLDEFHNRHKGQRCFVVGNGPSLQQLDMSRLKDEITLGSNRCFLGYPTWGFPFTYWGVYDKFQIEEYHAVYATHVPEACPKFFPVEYSPLMNVAQGCPVNTRWPQGVSRAFSDDPAQVYVGFTVTYMLLQIAAIMGCNPIILIGTDHRYDLRQRGYSRLFRSFRRRVARQLRGGAIFETSLAAHRTWKQHRHANPISPALWSTQDATTATHFTGAYTDGGKNRFLPPEPEEAERDFECAAAWARKNTVDILNATPDSALTSFPRIDFDTLF